MRVMKRSKGKGGEEKKARKPRYHNHTKNKTEQHRMYLFKVVQTSSNMPKSLVKKNQDIK